MKKAHIDKVAGRHQGLKFALPEKNVKKKNITDETKDIAQREANSLTSCLQKCFTHLNA